jgi:ketosteroid isomerase-like protein
MGLLSLKEWRSWDSLSPSSGSAGAVEQNLMDVDRAFSKLSTQKGYIEAFYTYIANDGINISAAGGPPANKETFRKRLEWLKEQTNPPQVHLVWDPILAHVASSEDLGFTTGGYVSNFTDPSGKKMEGRGYYLSIWQKQPDGAWKFVFDAGNQVQE